MMDFDLVATFTGQASDGFQDVNGYVMHATNSDIGAVMVPYGTEYPAPLVTSSQPNQKDGITNGTFTSDANATAAFRPATTISGQGSGATFTYLFDGSGNLSTLVADGAGTGYLEGDHLSITTTAAHGSQTIKFRLVEGSNRAEVTITLVHDAVVPFPSAMREIKVTGTDDRTLLFMRKRS